MEQRYRMLLLEIRDQIEIIKKEEGADIWDLFDLLDTIEEAINGTVKAE